MPEIPAGYEIGRPHRDELANLPAIEIAAAALFPAEDLAPALQAERDPLSFFEQAFSAGRLWVARTLEPAAPVGFAAATLLDRQAHLQEIDVLPEHGRQGLGRALVVHVIQWAQAMNFPLLTLTTFRHLAWNAPFYESFGFAEIPAPDLGSQIRISLEEDARMGLDPSRRIAMRLDLRVT
jgi:GNAT superfamily N-acetyltransferase